VSYHDNGGFDLTIEHLPQDRAYGVEQCSITRKDDFKPTRTVVAPGGAVHLRTALPPPAVELVTVRALEPGKRAAIQAISECDAQ
jgi:hypothetical protein